MKSKFLAAAVLAFLPSVAGAQTISTTVQPSFDPSSSVGFNFTAPGNKQDYIAIVAAGSVENNTWPLPGLIEWNYIDGTHTGTAGIRSGVLTFPPLPVGSYEARLYINDTITGGIKAAFNVATPPPSGSGARLVWDVNTVGTLTDVNATAWTLQIDNQSPAAVSPNCSGSVSPFKCSLPYPTVAPGVHLYTIVGGGVSLSLLVAPLAPTIVLQ